MKNIVLFASAFAMLFGFGFQTIQSEQPVQLQETLFGNCGCQNKGKQKEPQAPEVVACKGKPSCRCGRQVNRFAGCPCQEKGKNNLAGCPCQEKGKNNLAGCPCQEKGKNNLAGCRRKSKDTTQESNFLNGASTTNLFACECAPKEKTKKV